MILTVGPTPTVQYFLVLPNLVIGQVNRAQDAETVLAGKGVNTARAVAQLGGTAGALGFAGRQTGSWPEQTLASDGVEPFLIPVPGHVRMCLTLLQKSDGSFTELVQEAEPVSDSAQQALMRQYEALLGRSQMVTCSGSLPAGVSVKLYAEMLERANAQSVPSIVDATADVLLASLSQRPLVVKPNRQELAAATGKQCSQDADMAVAIEHVHRLGARHVLVTDGASDVMASDGRELIRLSPPAIQARNPIGCGDAVTAGLAISLTQGKAWSEAAAFAVACGSASAAEGGYGRLVPSRVRDLLPQVRTRRL